MSSASTVPHSSAVPANVSSNSTVSGLTIPELSSSTSWTTSAPNFLMTQGRPNTPLTPGYGPPVMAPRPLLPIPSNFTGSTVPTSSISAIPGSSFLTVPGAPNMTLQPQFSVSYPPLNSMASSHQGVWLQPPQMGAMSRPPFVPYPALFPGPLPFSARAVPLSSVPLPDPQPPGVTPVRDPSVVSLSSSHHQQLQPTELSPPGTEYQKPIHGVGISGSTPINVQTDAWTAHKTDNGIEYYYNALTGESTYEKPSGFNGKVSVEATPTSTPASVSTLCGDWVAVTTGDGKKYYYNSKIKVSSWQIPSEVVELRNKQEGLLLKEHSLPVPTINASSEKPSAPTILNAPAINSGGRDAVSLRPSVLTGSSSALDLIKKKLQDSGAPLTSPVLAPMIMTMDVNSSNALDPVVRGLESENKKDKPKDANHDGSKDNLKDANHDGDTLDSSSDSEDVDNGPTNQECIIQFKEMLKERGVAPFSKWDKELPKILFDPRFKVIPSYSARRLLFEHYVKTRAEEERKEKRAAHKAAIEGFKHLLEEVLKEIDQIEDYHSFKRKYGSDPRFEALERKDQEHLLNERIFSLKKLAEEKAQALRAASTCHFKSMLREKGDIDANSRWSKVKDSLRIDHRYTSVKHEDREVLFNEYISELKAAEQEAEQDIRAKRQKQDKLKEMEREWRKRKDREEQEMERVRTKVRRKEAVASFQALLMETIKDPQASWTESKSKLEKDPQGRTANPGLDPSDGEKLFREHIKMLQERCAHEFRSLLGEVIRAEGAGTEAEDGKTALNSWSTAKRFLKADPRYGKVSRKEREPLWRKFTDDLVRSQKLEKLQQQQQQHDPKRISSKNK